MRKDLTIYALLIAFGFLLGLFTCKSCTKEKECPPVIEPLEGGRIVDSDTVTTISKDSAKTSSPQPERITLPTLAAGRAPLVFSKPMPVYMPADTPALIAQYKALYKEMATLKEYDQTYAFALDSVRVRNVVQNNALWSQQVDLVHADRTITNTVAVPARKRNQVYWGAGGAYRPSDSLLSVGSSLMFLHKKGWAFEAGASIDTRGRIQYQGGMKWKIGIN